MAKKCPNKFHFRTAHKLSDGFIENGTQCEVPAFQHAVSKESGIAKPIHGTAGKKWIAKGMNDANA